MNLRKLFAGALFALALPVVADDGMWMPQQVPALKSELEALGLKIDANSFADLTGYPMGAIVQLTGCSGTFVSPNGLIATNHHCVAGSLQYNATPQNDVLTNGFLAKSVKDEIPASPDARVYVTTAIEDVTKQILGSFPKNTSDADRTRLIARRRREMVEACQKPGNLRCQVASFFEGAQYLKITQMEIRDVRLVYAPALGIGNFGDETDNWMWPRHTGDFAFYRAYVGPDGQPADRAEGNVPYRPKHHLKLSTRDLDEGDLIMIAGFPGRTSRHITAAEVEHAQATELPLAVRFRTMLMNVLQERSKESREIALKNASRISGLENYQKKYIGSLEAFERGSYLDVRRRQEAADRAKLDEKLGAQYDAAVKEVQTRFAERSRTTLRDTIYAYLYTSSPMLTQANHLYRLSVERPKAELDRAEDYTERQRRRLQSAITRNRRSIEPASDRAGLRLFLLEATKLPADQRIKPLDEQLASTGKATPEAQVDALLDRIYASTSIGNAEVEGKMWDESTAQLTARNDSMIAFAAALRSFGAELDKRDAEYEGAMSRLRPVILDVLRVARGGRLYPDANSTLRVGFGQVKGYAPRNAVVYTAQTDIRGVVEKDTGEEPFNSPKRLLELAGKKDFGSYVDPDLGTLPVAFISTNVVTNGSSGSSTLNAYGEVCGLAFDSNWEGVGSDYVVEEDITRTIAVDSRYMLWVMEKVDGATNLLQEMGIAR
ncbi:MAG TPA: S46 family peptidase [Thermoanaerobaculia bacterium]